MLFVIQVEYSDIGGMFYPRSAHPRVILVCILIVVVCHVHSQSIHRWFLCQQQFIALLLFLDYHPFSLAPYQVEVKPYVLDDQVCDECQGMRCNGRYAPYFCGNIHCLRYYCEHCWAAVHSAPGTQNHRCFIKENGDRPRAINFFPSHARLTLP